jgi:hypothetical protein
MVDVNEPQAAELSSARHQHVGESGGVESAAECDRDLGSGARRDQQGLDRVLAQLLG